MLNTIKTFFSFRKKDGYAVKRREILCNPKVQITIVGFFVFLFFAMAVTFYATNIFIFGQIENIMMANGADSAHPMMTQLSDLRNSSDKVIIFSYLCVFFTIFSGGALLSHKIVGPIFKLYKHLQKLNAGEAVDEVYFRRGDFFTELQIEFNAHMRQYRNLKDKES